MPIVIPSVETGQRRKRTHVPAGDRRLRGAREVRGYHIEASDDAIGHVADFLFEESTWAIPYAIVDTRNWLPGKQVRIATKRIRSVNWDDRTVIIDMSCAAIRGSPPYEPMRHAKGIGSMGQHPLS
jgi:hypothetical protein